MAQIHPTDEEAQKNQNILFDLLFKSVEIISLLQQENDTLRNIIDVLPGNVYWKNLQGKFLGCNNNTVKISGLNSSSDLIGKSISDLFDEKIAALAIQNDKEVIQSGKEHNYEEIGPNTDNQLTTYLSKKMPLRNSAGEIIGTIGVSFDISERKKMEEELIIAKKKAEISNRAKSQFVAAVNHELRTPLASIIGLIDLLKEEPLQGQESKKIISSIENSAQHLLNLVNDVLDFSRLETDKQPLQIAPFNFYAVFSEVYDLLEPLAKNKNLSLLRDIPTNLPPFLLSDARILRHILINLASNAIKYTEKGQVVIKVDTLKQDNKHIQLKISISDTGSGIPADKLKIIFKPFHQLTDANLRQSSRNGAGLGLTIVKKLAEIIKSTLHVESELGKGSTFSFTMECAIPDENTIDKNLLQRNQSRKKPIDALRVLVIEDDPIIQYIHKKLLSNLQCQVDTAENASEAIKLLDNQYDIIFSDSSLPDISGHELIKQIRKSSSDCPIVVISAFLDKDAEAACQKAGANDFVSKPISLLQFKELLNRHCYVAET